MQPSPPGPRPACRRRRRRRPLVSSHIDFLRLRELFTRITLILKTSRRSTHNEPARNTDRNNRPLRWTRAVPRRRGVDGQMVRRRHCRAPRAERLAPGTPASIRHRHRPDDDYCRVCECLHFNIKPPGDGRAREAHPRPPPVVALPMRAPSCRCRASGALRHLIFTASAIYQRPSSNDFFNQCVRSNESHNCHSHLCYFPLETARWNGLST